MLRQRSRPYLFSNSVSPAVVAASLKALELVEKSPALLKKLRKNTRYFRKAMIEGGFDILPGEHPIVPIMLEDAVLAQTIAAKMLKKGIYVIGFCFPVVPEGKARIRTQISAAHSQEDLEYAVKAFIEVKQELGI